MKRFAPAVVILAPLALGCSSSARATPTGTSLAEDYRRLGDGLGATIARAKSSATAAGAVRPAGLGAVAPLPKTVTGDVELGAEQQGKTGKRTVDIDAKGSDEELAVFVPAAPTGTTGTAATLPSFVAWRGDAESGDEGLCHLAWSKGSSWFVTSPCGDDTGAWVCQVSSSEISCQACSAAGECSPCDLAGPDFQCSWR